MFDHPTVATLARFLTQNGIPQGLPNHEPRFVQAAGPDSILVELQLIMKSLLGMEVPPDAPLMAAGVDSLGEWRCHETCWLK